MPGADELHSSLLLAMLILLGCIVLACCSTSNVSVDGLKEEIDKECPTGSHYSKVIGFLDSKGIQHSPYQEAKEYHLSIGDYIKVRIIGAQIPRVKRRMFITWTIYIRFDFDEGGRLTEYKVRESRDDP
ncbi:MAG: hypothetical protein AABN34_04635 [Acidobacteriota bacterium]